MHQAYASSSEFFVGASITFVCDNQLPFVLGVGDKVIVDWPSRAPSSLRVDEASGDEATLTDAKSGTTLKISRKQPFEAVDGVYVPSGMKAHYFIVRSRS